MGIQKEKRENTFKVIMAENFPKKGEKWTSRAVRPRELQVGPLNLNRTKQRHIIIKLPKDIEF